MLFWVYADILVYLKHNTTTTQFVVRAFVQQESRIRWNLLGTAYFIYTIRSTMALASSVECSNTAEGMDVPLYVISRPIILIIDTVPNFRGGGGSLWHDRPSSPAIIGSDSQKWITKTIWERTNTTVRHIFTIISPPGCYISRIRFPTQLCNNWVKIICKFIVTDFSLPVLQTPVIKRVYNEVLFNTSIVCYQLTATELHQT
jgi:hypothetical protein